MAFLTTRNTSHVQNHTSIRVGKLDGTQFHQMHMKKMLQHLAHDRIIHQNSSITTTIKQKEIQGFSYQSIVHAWVDTEV